MLGCQVTQTHLSLIAHTWPLFDQSRSYTPCVPPAQLTSKQVLAWLIYLNVISNVEDIKDAKKHLYSMKFKSQLRKYQLNRSSRTVVGKIKGRLANYPNELSGKWLEILREPSRQKLVCKKSNSCKIQGMSKTSEIHAAYSVQDNVEDVENIKTSHNRFLTDFLEFIWLLSKTSKMYVYKLQCRS